MADKRHVFVQADICDAHAMQKLFDQYQIDYVVNFAAESHVDRSITDPTCLSDERHGYAEPAEPGQACMEDGRGQLQGRGEVPAGLHRRGVRLTGTGGFLHETTPLDPHARTRKQGLCRPVGEGVCRHLQASGDHHPLLEQLRPLPVPEKLIPLMINNCLNKKSLPVYGDGMQIRDWLYVEDHCKAIDLVLQKGRIGEVYNVGGHNEQPNIAIVKSIISYVSGKVDPSIDESLIKHVTDRKGHDRRYGIDPSKIREELGWEPETMFAEGIGKTIDWYLENRQWMEHVTSGSYQNYYQEMYGSR